MAQRRVEIPFLNRRPDYGYFKPSAYAVGEKSESEFFMKKDFSGVLGYISSNFPWRITDKQD